MQKSRMKWVSPILLSPGWAQPGCSQGLCVRIRKLASLSIAFLCLLLLAGTTRATAATNEVTKWNEISSKAAIDSTLAPFQPHVEARLYAMTCAAIHDALNAIDRQYQSYALRWPSVPNTSPEAAVAAAAHRVLVDQFGRLTDVRGLPSQQAALDAAYAESLAQIPEGAHKRAGVLIGEIAAETILARRAGDGWETQPILDFNYVEGTKPGEYRFTGNNPFAALTQWGNLATFVLRDGSQFRPRPPLDVRGRRYALDLNEVKYLGGDGVTTPSARTPEQTQIGLFWLEDAPQKWNRIARNLSEQTELDLWQSARLYALLNLALADGYIASFNTKYHYKFWRPETAIHEADRDGNPNTSGDSTWTPLSPTPPFPDYDSAHAVEGAAAAQVFRTFFETDDMMFSACSTTLPKGQNCCEDGTVFRSYTSFSQAAEENGYSRVLIGIHFRDAFEEGIKHGQKIGNRAVSRFLRPVHDTASDAFQDDSPSEEANQ